jgi:hypothetical protein
MDHEADVCPHWSNCSRIQEEIGWLTDGHPPTGTAFDVRDPATA